MKYRKIPLIIDAAQWPYDGSISDELFIFMSGMDRDYSFNDDGTLTIHTLEGDMSATPGYYIIKGIGGEYYTCNPDIFEMTYEPAE